jgi:tRNA(Ser,Leu) C12 N-acetylase TAN1
MKNWNLVVTVVPGPGHVHRVLDALRRWGEFHSSNFKDVCLGRVEDTTALLEAIRDARESGEEWCDSLGRVIPIERIFHFTPETLTEKLKEAVTPFCDRMQSGTFHVRLERRGLTGEVISPKVEREVADHLFTLAEARGKSFHTAFEDPDYVVAAETLGNDCGVALLPRELRARYPFVQTR